MSRLLRAAAGAPRSALRTTPLSVQTAALAGWRRAQAGEDLFSLLPLFRQGLAFACTLLLVSLALGYHGLLDESSDDLAVLDPAIELETLP